MLNCIILRRSHKVFQSLIDWNLFSLFSISRRGLTYVISNRFESRSLVGNSFYTDWMSASFQFESHNPHRFINSQAFWVVQNWEWLEICKKSPSMVLPANTVLPIIVDIPSVCLELLQLYWHYFLPISTVHIFSTVQTTIYQRTAILRNHHLQFRFNSGKWCCPCSLVNSCWLHHPSAHRRSWLRYTMLTTNLSNFPLTHQMSHCGWNRYIIAYE